MCFSSSLHVNHKDCVTYKESKRSLRIDGAYFADDESQMRLHSDRVKKWQVWALGEREVGSLLYSGV